MISHSCQKGDLFVVVLTISVAFASSLKWRQSIYYIYFLINLMKQSKANQAKPKIQEANSQELLVSAHLELEQWFKNLKKEIKALDEKAFSSPLASDKPGLTRAYIGFLADYCNHDLFDIDSPYSANLETAFKAQKMLKSVFLASGLLTKMSKELNLMIAISETMASEFSRLQNQAVEAIIQQLMIYSKGYLSTNGKITIGLNEIGRSSKGDLRYYQRKICNKKYAIYSIGHQILPSFNHKLKQVTNFKVILTIQLEAIRKVEEDWEKESVLKQTLEGLERQKEYDVKYGYKAKQLTVDEGRKPKNKVEYFSWKNLNLSNELIRKYHAQPITPLKCSPFQSEQFMFQYNEQLFYRSNNLKNHKPTKQNSEDMDQTKQINYVRAQEYVEFLTGIPNFKFKLTRQQRSIMGKDGNLIVIGRSGTGKTLVSILRLYAIQFLTKSSQVYSLMRQGEYKMNCIHHYINKIFKEKNTFLTASSFLIEEIMKQYRDMHYHLQKEHKETCEECRQHLHIGLEASSQNMDLDAILDSIERRQNIRSSVSQLKRQSFPEFFTVKSLLNILDSGLQRPFFDHEQSEGVKEKGESVVNIYWQGTYWAYQSYEENLKILFKNRMKHYSNVELSSREKKDKTLTAMEIDYKIFADNIWKDLSDAYFKVVKKKKSSLNASVVWAQIYSIIKGSARAHVTHLKCLSPLQYLEQSKSPFLTLEDKIDIYHMFQQYQKYKNCNKAYDMMDIVNHILQQVMLGRYADQKLDNVFIDEVQDLTPATIYLLTIVTRKNIFYCGDTAQAISKGVTFKFSQIKSLFSKKYFQKAVEKDISNQAQHLTVNFRTHNRVLKLANMVVSMIKELFPKSIDILEEERSDLFGPKPLLINDGDQRLIYQLLLSPPASKPLPAGQQQRIDKIVHDELVKRDRTGRKTKEKRNQNKAKERRDQNKTQDRRNQNRTQDRRNQNESQEQPEQEEEQEYIVKARELMSRHLSSQQVILIRSKKEKEELPCFLKKQLKLTCEEVKGLEYQDVVIYKFFESSPCPDKWGLLDYLDIKPKFIDEKTFQAKISRRAVEEGRQDQQVVPPPLDLIVKIQLGYDRDRKMYKVLQLSRNGNYEKIDIKDFHEICSELKLFYTLLTRAKNTVIIFDQKVPRQLMKLLQELEVVKTVNPSQITEEKQSIRLYRQKEMNVRYLNKENLWNEEGIRQLVRKNYDQAINCFEKAQNKRGVQRAQAEKIIQSTKYELHQIDNQLNNPTKLTRQEFKMKKIKLIRRQQQLNAQLCQAAALFEKIEMHAKAGQIYAKTRNYEGALRCFQLIDNKAEIADAYYQLKQYQKAVSYYKETNNINRVAECYLKLQMWKQALTIIKDNQDLIKFEFDENPEMRNIIKQSLSDILNSIMHDDERLRSEQQFNKGFARRQKEEMQNKLKQQILGSNFILKKARLKQIVCQYNLFNLNQMCPKIQERRQYLGTYQKQMSQLQAQHKQIRLKTKKHEDSCAQVQKQLEIIDKKIKIQARSLDEIQKLRTTDGTIYHREIVLKKQRRDINDSIQQNQKQLKYISSRKQTVQQIIDRFTSDYGSTQKLQQLLHNISEYLKLQKKEQASLPALVSQLINAGTPVQSEQSSNVLYKIWLSQHTINSILQQAKSTSAIAFRFIRRHEKKILSFFDHRSIRNKIEAQLCSKDQQMEQVLSIYQTLQMLNCIPIRYVLCEKHLLRFHLQELILEDILRGSKNFYQKRRVKEIERIAVPELLYSQIQRNNQEKLDKLTIVATTASFTEYITKETTYEEPCLQNLRLGLILQGFYQNSLILCTEQQRIKLLHIYMDYDRLLKQAVLKAKSTNMKLKQQMKYLFFGPQTIGQGTVYHLVNASSIQKIYFDFDQCESSPILGKPYSIEDIELQDHQIQECSQKAEQIISQNKKRIANIPLEIKEKRQKQKNISRDCDQSVRNARLMMEQSKKRIQKITKTILPDYNQQIRYESSFIKKDQQQIQDITKSLKNLTKEKNKAEGRLKQLQRQFQEFKVNQINSMQEEQFRQQLLARSQKLRRNEEQAKKVIQKEGTVYKLFEQRQGSLKLNKNKLQRLVSDRKRLEQQLYLKQQELVGLNNQIAIDIKKKQADLKDLEDQIVNLEKLKIRWERIQLSEENEAEINREAIKSYKAQIVQEKNQNKKKQIIRNIHKSSNLTDIKQFQLLNRLITKQLDIKEIVKDKQSTEQLIKVFSSTKEIAKKTLKHHQMCMIVISYLNFLFNQEFRHLCLTFCHKIRTIVDLKKYQNFAYEQNKARLQSFIAYNQQKLRVTIQKLNNPQNYKNPEQLKKQKNYFTSQLQKLTNQYNVLNQTAQSQGLALLSVEPIEHILNLLSLYQIIRNASDKNYAFLQIFLGFFQCRIIKECEPLSFLEGQYVFVAADSIILSKLQASDKSMCYCFDSQNKIVLAPFSSVYKAVLDYLQKQQIKIYEEVPELMKFKPENNQLNKLSKKNNYLHKDLLGYQAKDNDILMHQGQMMAADRKEREEIGSLYLDYRDNRLLSKVKVLKRQVLEFYLSKELKDKQSFFFALYQLRQYSNIEKVRNMMKFFNAKIMRQLKAKVLGLQEAKNNWIQHDRNQQDPLPSLQQI